MKPQIYDAQAEYMEDVRKNAGPRNVPAHLMSRIRAANLGALQAGISSPEDAAIMATLSGNLLQWDSCSKLEKIEKVAMLELGEVRALLANENDNEVLLILLNRKKEIELQQKR